MKKIRSEKRKKSTKKMNAYLHMRWSAGIVEDVDRFIRCQAKTKSGEQCKTGAMSLTPFCGMHQGSEHPHVKKLEKEKTRNKDL